jgi:Membrane protein involved in the export of O-antigen and teichoic acid
MAKQTSIKTNFIFNLILTASNFIFPLITFPYVSRILLPIGTGKVSFAISVIYYFNVLAQLGIPIYGIRACAKVREDKTALSRTVHELLLINLAMCIFAYTSFAIALALVPKLYNEKTLMVIASSTILLNSLGVEWLYKALEKYAYISIRSIVAKLIALVGIFLLIHQQSDYVLYAAITTFASVASNILNFINLRKHIEIKSVGSYNFKQHFRPIATFFAMSVATTVYIHIDTVVLGFIKTDMDVGYYDAAVRIKSILVAFVTSLGTVLLPRSTSYLKNGLMDAFTSIAQKALNFVIILASSVSVFFLLFAKEGIFFLSGSAYEGAILPMKVIMPAVLFIGMTNILGIQMLVPLGKEKYVLYSEIGGMITSIIINVIFVPKLAAVGSAMATLSAEVMVFFIQFCALKAIVSPIFKQIRTERIIVALLIASIGSMMVKNALAASDFITLLASGFVFYALYGACLITLKEPVAVEIKKQAMNSTALKRIVNGKRNGN